MKSNTNNRGYDHLIKLMLIGESGVGKSSLLLRYGDDVFTSSYISTIGIDFKIKTVELNGKHIKLQIWDTAGQERFRTITNAYYRGAMGIMLVFSVDDPKSYQNIKYWMSQIDSHRGYDVAKILVGNKSESRNRIITFTQGKTAADEQKTSYIETSAKTGYNVNEAFTELIKLAYQMEINEKLKRDGIVFTKDLYVKKDPCCS